MIVDADVVFTAPITELSYLDAHPIVSLPDVVRVPATVKMPGAAAGGYGKRFAPFCQYFDTENFDYLSCGSMMVKNGTLDAGAVLDGLDKFASAGLLRYPEQDLLAFLYQGKLGYFPEGYGAIICGPTCKIKQQIYQDAISGKYKFVHDAMKPWEAKSSFHSFYVDYMNKLGLGRFVKAV